MGRELVINPWQPVYLCDKPPSPGLVNLGTIVRKLMAITVFKDSSFHLSTLLDEIDRGEIALPDIQRPFVWKPAKSESFSTRCTVVSQWAICYSGLQAPKQMLVESARIPMKLPRV